MLPCKLTECGVGEGWVVVSSVGSGREWGPQGVGLERGGWPCSSVGREWEWGQRGHLHGVNTKVIPERCDNKGVNMYERVASKRFGLG